MKMPDDFTDFDRHHATYEMVACEIKHNDCTGYDFNQAWFRLKEIPLC